MDGIKKGMKKRNNILTIAGFDPTGGAGILADTKVFEAHKCLGMAIQTANTIQTENNFLKINWIEEDQIVEQLTVLFSTYTFKAIKIGLFPSIAFLSELLILIRLSNPTIPIIWDPVLSASAGFEFENNPTSKTELENVLKQIDWITPNWNEAKTLSANNDAIKGAITLSNHTKVYLKGGHNTTDLGKDYLIEKGKIQSFTPKNGTYYEKHGSGCVFSSALAANLANGYPQQKAILRAKRYIEHFLSSSTSKLGRHYG